MDYALAEVRNARRYVDTFASSDNQSTTWTGCTGSIYYTRYCGTPLHELARSAEQARHVLGQHIRISMPISGNAFIRQGSRRISLMPGTAATLHPTMPFAIESSSDFIDTVEICVSISDLAIWGIDGREIVGRTWSLSKRSLAIRDFVAEMLPEPNDASARTSAIVESIMLRFALLVIEDGCPRDQVIADGHERLRMAALAVVESRFADPRLSPETIASSLHTSVRSLYRAFEETGTTVGILIRDKRLEKSAVDLAQSHPRETIAAIARRNGFRGADQFSRTFRRRFATTPQEFRNAAAARLPVSSAR